MQFLTDLWLPILLSAIAVFMTSSILWMCTPLHKKDYTPPPNEDAIMSALSTHNFGPGQYYVPWCGGEGEKKDMKNPEFIEKMKRGPWAQITVMSSPPSFGKCLGQWFAWQVIVAVFVAYAAHTAVSLAAVQPEYMKLFQIVGVIAFIAQAAGSGPDAIWKGMPWKRSFVMMFDGLVYALITAGIFAAMWPKDPVVIP